MFGRLKVKFLEGVRCILGDWVMLICLLNKRRKRERKKERKKEIEVKRSKKRDYIFHLPFLKSLATIV